MDTITQTQSVRDGGLDIVSLGYVTVPVADIAVAREFYGRVLGLEDVGTDRLPGFDAHAVLRLPSRQLVILTGPQGPDTRNTGVHHGYRVGPAARAAIAERLAADDVEVLTYKEDRPKEEAENFYFLDRDGNRIQLVVSEKVKAQDGIQAIDHTVVLAYDMLWAESYYGHDLKFPVESRVGIRTADHSRARRWAAGEENMAPGTRRLDKLYMMMGGQSEVPRANMQVYFSVGDSVFGIYLAIKHQQEPPEEQIVGAPRTAFVTARGDLDRIAGILQKRHRLHQGPVEHPPSAPFAASLYCKDLSGNFLEFCAPRG
jgi:catechol 2,3-dioxygenase-like lactoylglutathione lyase family enzyme